MTKWHLNSKRKMTGGRVKVSKKKKKYQRGSKFLETKIGERKIKFREKRGGKLKIKILSEKNANVLDKKTKKIKPARILSVEENQSNLHYVRRNILTKGAIIKTDAGLARITSRPGQEGVINAVLVEKK